MLQLTLRTLLAYIDDTLEPSQAQALGKLVAESDEVKELVERIKKVTRRRGLTTPVLNADDDAADPNTVAAYLDNALDPATIKQVEETCLTSDVHLAEVAACHQILTLLLTEPARVPPRAHRRMYQLVPAPAAAPNRQPNKALPIGGIAPPAPESPDEADPDAAYLLGMRRYASATTWAARFALVGTAALLLVFLAGAAVLSLQRTPVDPPEVTLGHSSQLSAPAPVVVPPAPVPPVSKPKDKEPVVPPKPKDKEPDPVPPMPPPRKIDPADVTPVDPGPGLGDPIPPASAVVRDIATVKTTRALVVTQPTDGAGWVRLRINDKDDRAVESNSAVMALPGYKADVSVDQRVLVRLWGNVPEQLPYRVFESRVKFHVPPTGFDADITLLGGRVYLKSEKPTGAKVRLRVGPEVWDVTIPDANTDVLAELVSWYAPGTPYARKDGTKPRLEARVAVALGTAALETRGTRFKKIDKLSRWHQVTWDSSTDTMSDPVLIEADQRQRELLLDRDPSDPLKGDLYKQVQRLLTATADKVTTRELVTSVVKERIGPELPDVPPGDRGLVSRMAIYARAAMADSSPDGAVSLSPLVDVLRSELPWLARQAVVTALVNWVARDVGNTERLLPVFVGKSLSENSADALARLLRGFVSPLKPDPARLDELVAAGDRRHPLLGDPEVALREAALWNLMAAKLESWVPLPLDYNVGNVGAKVDSDEYRAFLRSMTNEVEGLKKRGMPLKK
ncbi:MAG: hypothetical protein FJ304_07615 [Planctomycetes bacterium]|nr:hypothetical protein [Planctomycetota bacterium]